MRAPPRRVLYECRFHGGRWTVPPPMGVWHAERYRPGGEEDGMGGEGVVLTAVQRRRVLREMRSDPPVAWPSEEELAGEFSATARQLFGVEVGEAEARVAVAGKFRD